jgi:hypothetical protein
MFSPLAFGAVEAWSIFVVEGSAGALFLLWMRTQLGSPQLNIRWNPVFAPMLAFAGLFAIQLMPGRSAYWHATGSQALLFAACGMICFLIGQTFTQHRQVRKIASALTIYGSAVALIAVLQNLTSPNRLYWLRTPRFGGWIFGPYVNHNHYAGLMEMLVPVPLVFAFSRFGRTHQRRAAVVAAVFMSLTIFLSGSRGGMLAFLVEIAVFAAFVYRGQQKQQRLDPKTQMGPLVSEEQLRRVCGYMESGLAEGAKAVAGGRKAGDKGYFVEPTVFVDTTENMKIVQEEIFGPVVVAMPFTDPEEIVPRANDNIYGLAAGVWTSDVSKAHRMAEHLQAGTV